MTRQDINFLCNLIIKLDVKIDAEYGKVSAEGLALIYGFTEEQRKECVKEALEILEKVK